MREQTFQKLTQIIHRESGITLSSEKRSLLENRIQSRLRQHGVHSEEEYLNIIELDVDGKELIHLIDAVSTNVTHFYREKDHFELFAKLLTRWEEEGKSEIRVWCAAASSGEEPYTIAITVKEALNLSRTRFRMLATDICQPVLERAQIGLYRENQFRDMPDNIQKKYFTPHQFQNEIQFKVHDCLKENILFKRLNLAQFPYPLKGPFDAIFCRNVMIYFDNDLRQKMIDSFSRLLRPGGMLFVGHSEGLTGLAHQFDSIQGAAYMKPDTSLSTEEGGRP